MVKIAFGYKMRSGKDTAVDHLRTMYGGVRLSFATPLYETLNSTLDHLGLSGGKDREYLQMVGTWARGKNPDVFVNKLLEKLSSIKDEYVFVSDVRHPNEFEALKQEGFYMVKIVRPGVSEQREEHSSETMLDDLPEEEWNAVVVNDGSLEEFQDKLDSLYQTVWNRERVCSKGYRPTRQTLPQPHDQLVTRSRSEKTVVLPSQ